MALSRVVTLLVTAGLAMTIESSAASDCVPGFSAPAPAFPIQAAGDQAFVRAITAGNFFTKDGNRCDCDLAIAASQSNPDLVVMLRGIDDGGFRQDAEGSIILKPGANPVAIASGQFSNQGLDDLVVVRDRASQAGHALIFIPNADGTYPAQGIDLGDVGMGPAPGAIVTGHFDSDQNLDFAVISVNDRKLTIFFGDGTGKFPRKFVSTDLAGVPRSLAVGRFTGRNFDDVAVATTDRQSTAVSIKIVRLNAAGNALEIATTTTTGDFAREVWVAAADLKAATVPRDLVVASWDDAADQIGGSVKMLFGNGSGSFTAGQQRLQLDARPRFVTVVDMDDDGVGDLVVAAHGDNGPPQRQDGIRIFKGARGSSEMPFNQVPIFTSPPSLPSPVTTGKFGGRDVGFASADLGKNSITVLLGSGTGAFTNPQLKTTPIPPDAEMVITGDFHSILGNQPLLDLAYVQFNVRGPDGRTDNKLIVLQNQGDRTFQAREPISLQSTPLLLAAGKFDRDQSQNPPTMDTVDIALIDANPDDAAKTPLLKILFGQGNGSFAIGTSEFALEPGEKPVAMTTGRFKGGDDGQPLDIAVVSEVAGGGKLTLFLNNGKGEFPRGDRITTTFDFAPSAIEGSNKFRPGGVFDFVVKAKESGNFMFFASGDGGFTRRQTFSGSQNNFANGSKPETILVGDLNSDGFDDVIMLNSDLTIDAFKNDGTGRFELNQAPDDPTHPNPTRDPLAAFRGHSLPLGSSDGRLSSDSKFFLKDFGNGNMGLAAVLGVRDNGTLDDRAVRQGRVAIVTLQRNKEFFGFSDAKREIVELPLGPKREGTLFSTGDASRQSTDSTPIANTVVGQFANALHGGSNADLGFFTRVSSSNVVAGACQSDPRPNPGPQQICHPSDPDPGIGHPECVITCPSPHCTGACIRHPLGASTCLSECPRDPPSEVCSLVPQNPFCSTTSSDSYVIIFRNTCSG